MDNGDKLLDHPDIETEVNVHNKPALGLALKALLLLAFINFLNQFDRRGLVTVFPLLRLEWGLSDAQLGLAVSLFTLSRAAIVFPAGWLADRIGILRVMRPAVFIWSILAVLSGWAASFGSFVSLRVGVGLSDVVMDLWILPISAKLARKKNAAYSFHLFNGFVRRFCPGHRICRCNWRTFWMALGLTDFRVAGITGCFWLIVPTRKATNPSRFS